MPIPSRPRPSVALAAPHGAAVEAAEWVMKHGGNAVDAVVAAAVSLTVTYPHMCSVGGDLIALVRDRRGEVTCVNASGAYGSGRGPRPLDASSAMPISGPETVTVPGAVSGWLSLMSRAGSVAPEVVLQPAIQQAEQGVAVSAGLAAAIRSEADLLRRDFGMTQTFLPHERPLKEGDLLAQPSLAETLRRLGRNGMGDFYRGEVASDLCSAFDQLGVPVTAEDLARHTVLDASPLERTFGGLRVITAPPNSQGYLLLEALGVIALHAPSSPLNAVDVGFLAEVFWGADRRRDEVLADPRWMTKDVSDLLAPSALALAESEASDRARKTQQAPRTANSVRSSGDTVAVTAVDSDGTAVSLIQSVFHAFGSGLLDPGTGIVLHNRGAMFNLIEGSPNQVRPGKRPAHTLMPVILEDQHGMVSAHGTMGGKAQPQILTQLIFRTLEHMTASDAVAAPRFVVGGLDAGTPRDGIVLEPSMNHQAATSLRGGRLEVEVCAPWDERVGHAMIARRDPDGSLSAGADPRSDGGALVY